jgi:hypothetical protein
MATTMAAALFHPPNMPAEADMTAAPELCAAFVSAALVPVASVAVVLLPTRLLLVRKDGTLPTVGSYSLDGSAELSLPSQHHVWKH